MSGDGELLLFFSRKSCTQVLVFCLTALSQNKIFSPWIHSLCLNCLHLVSAEITKNWDATQSNKMSYWSCKPFWIFAVMQMCLGFHSKLQTVVKKHCYSPTDLSAAHSKVLCSTGWTCCCSEKPCFCTKSDMEWNSKECFGHPFFSHCSCLQKCMRNSWVHFKNLPKCSLGPDKYRNSKSLLSIPRNHSLPIDVCNPTPTHSQLQV